MYDPWKQKREQATPVRWRPGSRELRVIAGGALWVWVACALMTYNAHDASFFFYAVPAQPYHNWCGALGAHIASLLHVICGSSSWLVLLAAVFIVPRKTIKMHPAMRSVALTGLLATSAALLHLALPASLYLAGGIVGKGLAAITVWVGGIGATLFYTSMFIFSGFAFAQRTLKEGVGDIKMLALYMVKGMQVLVRMMSQKIWHNADWLWYRDMPTPDAVVEKQPQLHEQFTHAFAQESSEQGDELAQVHHEEEEVPVDEGFAFAPELASEQQSEEETVYAHEEQRETETEVEADASYDDVVEDDKEDEGYFAYNSDEDSEYDEDVTEEVEESSWEESDELASDFFDEPAHETMDAHEEADDESDSAGVEHVYRPPEAFALPHLSMFAQEEEESEHDDAFIEKCEERGRLLEEKLARFGIAGAVRSIRPGPVITVFEYEPEIGSKVSRILSLEDDLALSLKAYSIRILAPVPGKNVVGFEIANEKRHFVNFARVIQEGGLQNNERALPITLGVDTTGSPVISDLTAMPHLLVAGATGSGKSVGMNVMLVSMLASKTPEEVRFILIDPKRLEFAPYADIPHLLFPIVTNPHEVAPVLKWVVQEMEMRYEVLARAGVRNIHDYRKIDPEVRFTIEKEVGCTITEMPYIVVMVDELADLMMVVGKEVEVLIARIAQMARAAGIHMIVATQRPSVDVVTGIIKVNFPSRIAFRVSSKVDSRTIVDGPGAEKLLGKGDMLFMSPASPELKRLHGPFVTDEEINDLTSFLKEQRDVDYLSLQQVIAKHSERAAIEDEDDLYPEVCTFLETVDEVSISLLQRKYRVGFNRSARLIEMLERDGKIAPAQGSKPRKVLHHER